MPDLSNAEESGGIVFVLRGDNGPLKATLKESKAEAQSLASHKYELTINVKSNVAPVVKAAKQQLIELYEVAREPFELKAPDDRGFKQFITSLRNEAVSGGEQIGRALRDGISRGGGAGGSGNGGGGHGDLSRKNLLSMRGLETSGIAGSATAAFALIEGVHIAGEIAGASLQARNIEPTLRQFAGTTTGGNDALMTQLAFESAGAAASQKKFNAISGIPIIGTALGAVGNALGYNEELQERQDSAKQQMQLHAEYVARGESIPAQLLSFQGKGGAAMAAEASTKMARDIAKTSAQYKGNVPGEDEAAIQAEYDLAMKKSRLQDQIEAQEQKSFNTRYSAGDRRISAIEATAASIGGTTTQKLAAQRAAAKFTYTAETLALKDQTESGLSRMSDDDPRRQGFVKEQRGKQDELDIKYKADEKQRDQDATENAIGNQLKIASVESQTKIARLQTSRQYFAAKLQAQDAADAQELERMEKIDHAEQGLIDKTKGLQAARRDLAVTENSRANFEAVGGSITSIASSFLQMGGNNFQAQQLTKRYQQSVQLAGIENPIVKGFTWAAQSADNAKDLSDHKFELQNRQISRDAEFATAIDRQKDLPISGQIEQAAAAARLAIRNADPSEREDVRKTEMAKFKATEHELLGLHGGGYAAKGTAFFTPGDPLGLGKGAEDRANAQAKAKQGEAEITAQQGKDTATIATWLTQTFGPAIMAALPDMIQGLVH